MSPSRRGSHRLAVDHRAVGRPRTSSAGPAVPDRWFWIAGLLWLTSIYLALSVVSTDPTTVGFLAFTTVGAFVAWRQPPHPLGWILLADGLIWLGGAAGNQYVTARPSSPGVNVVAATFDLAGWVVGLALVAFAVLLFPTGRLVGRASVIVARFVAIGGLVVAAAGTITPGPLPSYPELINPFGIEGTRAITAISAGVGSAMFFGGMVASLVLVVLRYRASSGLVLQQMKWLVLAAVLMLTGFAMGSVLSVFDLPGQAWLNTLPMLTVPLAIGVAVLRYRLWDLDLVVGRALKLGVITMPIVAIYVGLVAGVGGLVGGGVRADLWLVALATAAAATLLQPLLAGATVWAQRWIVLAGNDEDGPLVSIRTMGGFRVERDGAPITNKEWRSKKARQLLKILVARRGRPVHREQLMEILWPDDADPARVNRLAVAVSTVRNVLDPDRVHPTDYFVVSSDQTIRVDLDHLVIDVEEFLKTASTANVDHGWSETVLQLYVGEFLGEDVYEDWSHSLREEVRATYLRALDEHARSELEADPERGLLAYLRVLEEDPWDERAHIFIVDTLTLLGRHGEARRAHARYVARMTEIGVDSRQL